jgi:uncharacterized protein YbjT (DUF2867 family)
VEVAPGDFHDPESFSRAVDGAAGVFLMNGGGGGEPFRRLAAAAKARGNPRVVFLSSLLAADPEFRIGRLHRDEEDAIREAGLSATFVRPGAFMTNTYQWIGPIKSEGVVYNALGAGEFAPIAAEDVGAVAAWALTSPGPVGEVYELTGGELLSVPKQVGLLSRVLGRPIRCVDVPVEAAVQGMVRAGLSESLAEAVGESYKALRDGRTVQLRDTFERTLGRKPMTFEAWAHAHAARFA